MTQEQFKNKLLKVIDKLDTYHDKLVYLNDQFIKATREREIIILDMLEQLKQWGK